MAVSCPHCDLPLTGEEAARGACPSCGKGLQAAAPNLERCQTPTVSHPARRGMHLHWGWFIAALVALPVGLSLICNSALDDSPRSPSTSRRARSFEALVGERATEGISGLVFLALTGWFAYASMQNATGRGRGVAGAVLSVNAAVVLAAWLTPAVQRSSEAAWQKRIATPLQALPFGKPAEHLQQAVPMRNKVLVWDATASAASATQKLLPHDRAATANDASFTAVLILKQHDETTEKYTSGEVGITRTLTVGVVEYPEKKVVGTYLVRGNSPGGFVLRGAKDKGPIVGDTVAPLKAWILSGGTSTLP